MAEQLDKIYEQSATTAEAKHATKITLPPTTQFPEGKNVIECGELVMVGANGSGKTRLGVWLENSLGEVVHRVFAKKSLEFPAVVRPMEFALAERILRVGDEHEGGIGRRTNVRWQSRPETSLLNDYDRLLQYLFSDDYDQSVKYRQTMTGLKDYKKPPTTKLDTVKQIWESVLAYRELIRLGGKVEARHRADKTSYHAMNMSDGERVIFYMIGEALSVPHRGVFIVDEPELHLHRAIQARLWDAIERERPDCTFVYLTHDLDFAASRKTAAKVWLQDYTNGKWEWNPVPETGDFSEEMLLEILGSRKPILFVEGDRGSIDYFVYGNVYPEWTIIPSESCENVIHATASFMNLSSLHRNTCRGILDFDARTSRDTERLKDKLIEVLTFAELDNALMAEPLVRLIAKGFVVNPDHAATEVRKRVLDLLAKNLERVASRLTAT